MLLPRAELIGASSSGRQKTKARAAAAVELFGNNRVSVAIVKINTIYDKYTTFSKCALLYFYKSRAPSTDSVPLTITKRINSNLFVKLSEEPPDSSIEPFAVHVNRERSSLGTIGNVFTQEGPQSVRHHQFNILTQSALISGRSAWLWAARSGRGSPTALHIRRERERQ